MGERPVPLGILQNRFAELAGDSEMKLRPSFVTN